VRREEGKDPIIRQRESLVLYNPLRLFVKRERKGRCCIIADGWKLAKRAK
jgi:hypothetical protein